MHEDKNITVPFPPYLYNQPQTSQLNAPIIEVTPNRLFIWFSIVVILLMFIWSLVGAWQQVFQNFFYGYLGWNKNSLSTNFLVAASSTMIVLFIVFIVSRLNIVPHLENKLVPLGVQAQVYEVDHYTVLSGGQFGKKK